MPGNIETIATILLMGLVVYLSRAGGYVLGLQVRHIGRLRPVLEALPGCALMAILAPAAWNASVAELAALGCVVVIMWITHSVVLASAVGLAILLAWDGNLPGVTS